MRCIRALLTLLVSFAFANIAFADDESTATKIARAESAAPASISADATIVDVDGTVLREGSNGWTCLPGIPLIPGDDHPMCNDAAWTAWLAAAAAGEEFSTDTVGYSYMLQGDAMVHNHDPSATQPDDSGHWVQEGPHLMLLMPTNVALAGMSDNPNEPGPYVMWGGTALRHIMVPVGPRE
ncbi:MAG: hypothetical protein KJO31_09850 [Gammaproteobacteria bacterium]|nr:hypothetical protein [Gammaproteobacteria bacterium]